MATVTGGIFAVTGGLSGIGAATSRLLADRGAAFICVGDVSSKNLVQLKNEVKELNTATVVDFTALDVTSSQQVEQWIQNIVTKYGDLNGAANIAGIAQGAGLRTTPTILAETDAEWNQVMKVNLDGVFFCTRAEVRAMKDLPPRDRSIVNVSSIAAFSHLPDVYAYGTSKGATAYLTDCVAADAISLGIRVNGVSPGKLYIWSAFDSFVLSWFRGIHRLHCPNRHYKYPNAPKVYAKCQFIQGCGRLIQA